jgi:hypothetical protein
VRRDFTSNLDVLKEIKPGLADRLIACQR